MQQNIKSYTRSQAIVQQIIEELILKKVHDQIITNKFLLQACLKNSQQIQDSIIHLSQAKHNQISTISKQGNETRPEHIAFKPRKSVGERKLSNAKTIRSKTHIEKNKFPSQDFSSYQKQQKVNQLHKSTPIRLKLQQQRRTMRKGMREVSFISYNAKKDQLFKFSFQANDQKNQAIQKILRFKKKMQPATMAQKAIEQIFLKKSNIKKSNKENQGKRMVPIITNYNGQLVNYSKCQPLAHEQPHFSQVLFTIRDSDRQIQRKQNQKKQRNSVPKRQNSAFKPTNYQKLNFINQNDMFSKRFGRKFSIQDKNIQNNNSIQKNKSYSENQENQRSKMMSLKQKIKHLPKNLTLKSLFTLKKREDMAFNMQDKQSFQQNQTKTTLEKRSKKITNQIRQSWKRRSNIQSHTFVNEKNEQIVQETLNEIQTNKQKNVKIGSALAFQLLLSNNFIEIGNKKKNVRFVSQKN